MLTKEEQWVLKEKYGQKEVVGVTPHFEADRARLACGEPVAYVIGWQPFLGLKIYLDSRALIPRPETEWWVEQLLKNVRPTRSYIRCLDLCAGSGEIGCAMLAAFPAAQVYFGEVDPVHEATIRKNVEANPPSLKLRRAGGLGISRAHIGIGDLFEPFGDTRFDVIACNPPYVPQGRALPQSVTDYEPALALYSGADGLDLTRRIASELPGRLAPGGIAWIECDGAHAENAYGLFKRPSFSTELLRDQYGTPRVIRSTHSVQ